MDWKPEDAWGGLHATTPTESESGQESDKGYASGTWKEFPHFWCNSCGYDTDVERRAERHVLVVHRGAADPDDPTHVPGVIDPKPMAG